MKHYEEILPGFPLPYVIEMKYRRPLYNTMKQLRCSQETNAFIREVLGNRCLDFKEFFWVICLTRSNCVLCMVRISEGCISGTVASTQEIGQIALMCHASGIILCHNHPSGNIIPSVQDIQLTETIKKALDLFDVMLLDHLIITTENYFSFADEGRL